MTFILKFYYCICLVIEYVVSASFKIGCVKLTLAKYLLVHAYAHSICKRLPLRNALVAYGGTRGLPRRRIPIMSGLKLWVFHPQYWGWMIVKVTSAAPEGPA